MTSHCMGAVQMRKESESEIKVAKRCMRRLKTSYRERDATEEETIIWHKIAIHGPSGYRFQDEWKAADNCIYRTTIFWCYL